MTDNDLNPYKKYEYYLEDGIIEPKLADYVSKNIKYDLRYYQKEACSFFEYYLDQDSNSNKSDHLLYQMATGSGKTLVMAANILELYKRGYRNFLFFVDKSNIVEKTKSNFLNKNDSKYIFTDSIEIENRSIDINEVQNFEVTNDQDINIKFTTIQGLHEELNNPKENSTTYQDLEDEKLVLISDEAHHINALTKSDSQRNKSDTRNITTWEGTVNKILKNNSENLLLEFTATAGLDNDKVYEKYKDKVIYQYPLQKFRKDKFSKEVNVLESDTDPMTRAMNAVILSQYRRKVATNHGLANFKPVILMKSSKISESKDYQEKFHNMIENLNKEEIELIRTNSGGVISDAFEYFENQGISSQNLVREIKQEFNQNKTVSVNSKSESEEKQMLVNSLEDDDNNIRVVFAVDKLNEGWDVLNLFDIVRLYDKASSTSGPSKTTIKEAQLIGRGARYRPFKIYPAQDRFKRKYDDDVDNELRILEELYYHSKHNPDYIEKLKTALIDTGIMSSNSKEVELKVKDSFKKSEFWEKDLFINEKKEKEKKDLDTLSSIDEEILFKYSATTGDYKQIEILEDDISNTELDEKESTTYNITDLGRNVIRSSLQSDRFYQFSNLRRYFNKLDSTRQFIESDDFLGNLRIEIQGNKLEHMSQSSKYDIASECLSELKSEIKGETEQYKGSETFYSKKISDVVKDKKRKISLDDSGEAERGVPMSETNLGGDNMEVRIDLSDKDWYVYNENYGTSQEKYLIKLINDSMENIKEKYVDAYLIRNASLFKIHRFEDGKSIEPDFVLLLKSNNNSQIYQLFIEPKGEGFADKDEWKEEFLTSIKERYKTEQVYSDEKVNIVGLPFYNEDMKSSFKKELSDVLGVDKLF